MLFGLLVSLFSLMLVQEFCTLFKVFRLGAPELNYTVRPGGRITIQLNKSLQLLAGLNRFHLSNGQGFKHPHNPAYDGLGVFMGVVFRVN